MNEIKKVIDMCVQHQIIEVLGEGSRISPSFVHILISNLKQHPSILDAIAYSLRAYCPTAGVLELSLMATLLTDMISRRNDTMRDRIKGEIERDRAEITRKGEEAMKGMGLHNIRDVLKEIQTEKDLK